LRHIRAIWHRSAALLFLLLSAGTLSLSAFGVTEPVINALAYYCPNGNVSQQDIFNGTRHGWLGTCSQVGTIKYFTGEDNAGQTLSGQTVTLRGWMCGVFEFSQTYTTYNTKQIGITGPTLLNFCGPQTDSNSHEWVTGQWDWWWYEHY